MNLTDSFFEENYKQISFLDNDKKVSLIQQIDTNQIYVKKEIPSELMSIYKRIMGLNNIHVSKIEYVYSLHEKSFVIEEYISGNTIYDLHTNHQIIEKETALDYCVQILDGLSAIHGLGIIHRDITPKNIIVSNDGVCKILDFDISRSEKLDKTQDTTIMGTAGFASPEQFGFLQTSVQSDIYSVGVLLNYMLTGELPTVKKPDDKGLRKIVEKSTSINPKERYSNVKQMIRAIKSNNSWDWLPGFRTGIKWKKITASIIYAISWFFFSIYLIDGIFLNRESAIREIVSASITFVISPFIAGNIFYWDKRIPILNRFPYFLRMVIRIIVFCVILYYGMELYVGVTK